MKRIKSDHSYHVNLTDAAVIARIALANEAADKKVKFKVEQAERSFCISLNPSDFVSSRIQHVHGSNRFVIFETTPAEQESK